MSQETGLSPKIQAALAQLDPNDNSHWTNDGFPNTGVVQRIANDQTIRRVDIQATQPGFDRATAKAAMIPVEFEAAPVVEAAPATPPVAVPITDDDTVMISDDQLRVVLKNKITEADAKVTQGRAMMAEGNTMVETGVKALQEARRNFHKMFPPLTAAQATREYIDASNAERARRVAARGAASQLDNAKKGGSARGWNNTTVGPSGLRAYSRKEAQQLGFRVPGSPAAANPGPVAFRGGSVKG